MKVFLLHILRISHKIVSWVVQAADENINIALTATFKLSLVIMPICYIVESLTQWGVDNSKYISFVLGAIMIDLFFGVWKHLKLRTFSAKKLAIGLVMKLSLAVAGGFLFEGLNFLMADADYLLIGSQIVTRVIILMYPALSAFKNMYVVSDGTFPPRALMGRLEKWEKTLNPKVIIENKENGKDT
jgi:hypothetical protein